MMERVEKAVECEGLPNTLHELLDLALDDLQKIEKRDEYIVDMLSWHNPKFNGKCSVCLAGAMLANTCKFPKDSDIDWATTSESVSRKLDALDDLRTGDVHVAYNKLYGDWAEGDLHQKLRKRSEDFPITRYEEDPRKFKFQLRFLAKFLRKLEV